MVFLCFTLPHVLHSLILSSPISLALAPPLPGIPRPIWYSPLSIHTLQPRVSGTPMSSTSSAGDAAPQAQAMQAREAAPPSASYQQLATPPPASSGFAAGILPPGAILATHPQGLAGNAYAAGGGRYPRGKGWATYIGDTCCDDGESCWWSLWCPLLLFHRTTARFDLVKSPILFLCLMIGKKGRREGGREGGRRI